MKSTKITTSWENYKQARSNYGRQSPQALNEWYNFSIANRDIRNFKAEIRCEYEMGLMYDMDTNPKRMHSYLRQLKSNRPKIGPLLVDDQFTDDPQTIAECFVASFFRVLDPYTPQLPCLHQTSGSNLSSVDFTLLDVQKTLSTLDPNSSMGPDSIHPTLL